MRRRASRVAGSLWAMPGETLGLEADALVIVHERVSGIRVFLHVVGDESTFERALKLVGGGPSRHSWRRWGRRKRPYVECGVG